MAETWHTFVLATPAGRQTIHASRQVSTPCRITETRAGWCLVETENWMPTYSAISIYPARHRMYRGRRATPSRLPASIIRKRGHDLFTVKALKPIATEQVRSVFAQEGVKQALAIVGGVVAASLILAFGLKPEGSKAPAGDPVRSAAVPCWASGR
jgi:hypothetical protein